MGKNYEQGYVCLKQQSFALGEYTISPVQDNHIESIRLWRNAQRDVLRQKNSIEPEQQAKYFSLNVWPDMALPHPSNILFSMFCDGKLIGYGGLVHINWSDKRAEISFLLDPSRTGDANFYESDFSTFLRLLKEIAFRILKLHRIFTETYNIRPHHIKTLELNGFLREGVMKDHVIISNAFVDSIIHGCLNKDEK